MTATWGYEGRRVIVSGGGGAGMGAAAVRHLSDLGAEVHVLDLKEPPVEVASYQAVDLRDPGATAAAVEGIGGTIDALFNCAGLAGSKFPDLDVMLVNFVGMRHLAELVSARMEPGAAIASISSTAGSGYLANLGKWLPFVTLPGFDAAKEWCETHPEEIAGGYGPSKEAIIVWTLWASYALAERGIRANCISPGPTDTPMMPDFEQYVGKEFMENFPVPLGRRSTPAEQAWPLIFLNSPLASYVTGENVVTDGGTMGAVMTGSIDISGLIPESMQ
ncbi:MAG TPA: coniferyl-alcohol dehydrogenase [Acidimicrobiales bacterium]|nr:coniferyl-alcohol dehydrogenase [Acidimicrobiales bacterium]